MSSFSRRTFLAGSAALAASPALAAAPISGHQAPGYYRTKIGAIELTQVTDGAATFPMPDGFVVNVPKDTALAEAAANFLAPPGQIRVPFNPVMVNTGAKLVLIDTGYGPNIGPVVGHLPASMASAGVSPDMVDVVIISHLHPDHINGLKTKEGALAFPKAEIMMPEADWAFWMSAENAAKAEGGMMKAYFEGIQKTLGDLRGKVTLYGPDKEVVPGITTIDTAGHTPGHTSFVVTSGKERMFIQSDVTNIPGFFLTHPDWHVVYDVDPVKAEATRRRFYDMVAAEKALVAGYHFPFPALGHIEKAGTGYRLVPVAWTDNL